MRFITLTRAKGGGKIYCNVNNISVLYKNDIKGSTIVQFVGGENCYLSVLESPEAIANLIGIQKRGGGMKTYHVEGYFEGEIEANSKEEAEMNFRESDIDSTDIVSVWEDDVTE